MALEITAQVEIAFQDADKADQRLDEFLVRDRLVRILHDLGNFTQEQRRGNSPRGYPAYTATLRRGFASHDRTRGTL